MIVIWIEWQVLVREETTGQSLKNLPLPTLMLECSNAFMYNTSLQAFWKAKCLYFNLFGVKATLVYYFKLNSKSASGIYCWFCYSGHIGNISFVLNISFVWDSWYFPFSVLIPWEYLANQIQCKFCHGLQYQDFVVINQDRIENLHFTSVLILLEMLFLRKRLWKSV